FAMHLAAGANALHDLLAEVAALLEIQSLVLLGLLRQLSLADVLTVARNPRPHAEHLQRVSAHRSRTRHSERVPHGCRIRGCNPELVAARHVAGLARNRISDLPACAINHL